MPTISPDDTITISFNVRDRVATAAWYRQHLGFEEIYSAEEVGWTELSTNTPGVTIGLADSVELTPSNTMPVFGVADCEAARTALEVAGIKFDGDTIHVEGMVKVAAFADPDGNPLMIAEDLTK
ncbi:MAG: VOC family protein [Pseudomonadota bacterium]